MTHRITLPVALAAAATLLVAACSGSSTPAPSSPASAASAAPSAAASPAGSKAPTGSGGSLGGDAGVSFGAAADNLDKLTSYKFTVNMASTSSTAGTNSPATARTTSMTGTVINSPTKSYALQMIDNGTTTGAVVIGSEAWLRQGSAYQQVPAAMADTMVQTFNAYRPEKMFALVFGVNSSSFTKVGDESRNGVTAVHYKGDQSLSSVYATMFGVNATFTADVWIAKDGGYLVASEIRTAGATASGSGSYSSVINITDVNASANKVERPS